MANITHLSLKKGVPADGYWDMAFLEDMLEDIGDSDRQVFIIPGAYQADLIREINNELVRYKKVLVFITSDEEHKFDESKLKHNDMILYSQYGNGGYMFPLGYTTEARKYLKEIGLQDKSHDFFFAGQITHPRRYYMRNELNAKQLLEGTGMTVYSEGFAQGLDRKDYFTEMARAKTVPCPPGAVAIDSFRLYEALEAGAIPIADDCSPLTSSRQNYWKKLFGDVGFPTFTEYKSMIDLIDRSIDFPNMNNQVFTWWIKKKYEIREQLKYDLGIKKSDILAVVPISPIPSHPDTSILEETIESIRTHLDCPILLTFDGVRKEQLDRREDYEEFQRRMLWKCNFEYTDVVPILFNYHYHQAGMMRTVVKNTDYPMFLYVEQDTPLTPDREIDWKKCKDYIKSGKSNVIRFHFEEVIPEPHKHMMIGKPEDGFQKTYQWSQRPHLASREIYKIIASMFTKHSNCFIEDYMHGQLESIYKEQGMDGWNKWKLHIYHPEGGIKRNYHTDGRAGGEKYEDKQVW